MASSTLPKSPYTPEYSDELLALVVELYKDEIKHSLSDLQLSKMIDLIDIAQYNIEQYSQSLTDGNHNRCLKFYIVGLFYVYLVIPNSIQFQIKNKNYEIFLFLKQLYEKETNMSNVKLQVINYISYLNQKQSKLKQEQEKQQIIDSQHPGGSYFKRSMTMPSSALQHDLTQFLLSNEVKTDNQLDSELELDESSCNSSAVSLTSSSNSSIVEEWSPPAIQPKDQLQLVNNNNTDALDETLTEDDELSDIDESTNTIEPPLQSIPPPLPPHSIPPIPEAHTLKHASSFPESTLPNRTLSLDHNHKRLTEQFPNPDEREEDDDYPDLKLFPTKATHRKDSYQSVYANDNDEETLDVLTIASKSLYNSLQSGEITTLIFDIRPKALFEINHIPFDNVIQLDPSIVLNSMNYQEFEDSLKVLLNSEDFVKFKNLKKFDSVVSYSDNKTFFQNKHDYIVKFANLLNEVDINPKTISGGFDQWLKFISKTHLKNKELKFIAKVPIFTIPQVPAVPPPPPPSNINFRPIKSATFDYSKMFHDRTTSIEVPTRSSPSPTSMSQPMNYHVSGAPSNLVPVGKAPVATPAFQNQRTSTMNYQRPAQPAPQYPTHSSQIHQPYPVNNYYTSGNAFVPDSNIHQYQLQHQPQQQFYQPQHTQPSNFRPMYQSAPPQQAPPQPHNSYRHSGRTRSRTVPTIQNSPHPFVRLSITGLRNMKNTCYINSMVQCLFESRSFRTLFLDNQFQEYYNPEFFNKGAVRSNLTGNSTDPNVRLSLSLAKLFEKMYLNGGCSIVPSGFLKNCVQLRPDLNIPFEQQDTQEFLMFLLDRLHDELSNSNKVINDYPELLDYDKEGKLGKEYETWFNSVLLKQGFSPISQIFQGQLQDSLTCMRCGFKSSNYSSFFMLSLGIPKRSQKSGKKLKKIYLEDCIDLFTNDEILSGDNAWDCPKCSKPKDGTVTPVEKEQRKHRLLFTKSGFKFRGRSSSPAPNNGSKSDSSSDLPNYSHKKKSTIKSLNFVVLPPILIIHLSRFLFYDTSQKDDSVIQYPLILTIMHNDEPVRYKLFGVVNHSGTLKSGHYTSIANKSLAHDLERPDWYYFDDEVVKATQHGSINSGERDADRMSSSNVYVLFYERIV